MDDITLNLIVFAVLILIGGIIFLVVRRNKADEVQRIIQLAAGKNWTYTSIRERLAWGMRLTSDQWTLEVLSSSSGQESGPGSSDVSMSTTWHADVPGSTLLIGPRTSQARLGDLGDMLTRQVLQLALGSDADGLTEVRAGSQSFQMNYMLWAQDRVEAERLLTPEFESILLAWRGEKPVIKRSSAGLTIELRGVCLKKADEITTLVRLGELLI